jgi:hypothetical protein
VILVTKLFYATFYVLDTQQELVAEACITKLLMLANDNLAKVSYGSVMIAQVVFHGSSQVY